MYKDDIQADKDSLAVALYNYGITDPVICKELGIKKNELSDMLRDAKISKENVSGRSREERIDDGIGFYFSEIQKGSRPDMTGRYIREVIEKRIIKRCIKKAKDNIFLNDLINQNPYQRLLYEVFPYPKMTPELKDYYRFAEDYPENRNTLEHFSGFLRQDIIDRFNMNYMPPELIDSDEIDKALSQLPTQEQAVLRMRIFGEMKVAKVAEIMKVSEVQIRQLYNGSIRRLRDSELLRRNRFPEKKMEYLNSLRDVYCIVRRL